MHCIYIYMYIMHSLYSFHPAIYSSITELIPVQLIVSTRSVYYLRYLTFTHTHTSIALLTTYKNLVFQFIPLPFVTNHILCSNNYCELCVCVCFRSSGFPDQHLSEYAFVHSVNPALFLLFSDSLSLSLA